MATLVGPLDHVLELSPRGYGQPTADNDYDANWLSLRLVARDDRRWWPCVQPSFLTWEMREMVSWFRRLADATPDAAERFMGLENDLEFTASRKGDATHVNAVIRLSAVPAGEDVDDEFPLVTIEFAPGVEGLRRFTDELEDELRLFPVRTAEPDGIVSRHFRHYLPE